MRKVLIYSVVAVLALSVVGATYAGTEDDAKALAQRVAAYIKENGKDKGVAEIMGSGDRFKRGKFGLSVMDFSGLCLAHALFPKLVGQNHYTLKDPDGRQFVKDAIDIAKTKGNGFYDLSFTDPETKKVIPWKGYAQRVEGAELVVNTFFPAKQSK